MRGNSSTIPDSVFFEPVIDMRSFFSHNAIYSLPTLVVFLTIHETLLTARGQRTFFLPWSRMLLTHCDSFRGAPSVNVVRISNKRGQTAVMLD